MTIERMINILEEVKELDEFFQYNPKYLEDFNIMIETLKQLSCDDVISRQAVLELVADYDLSMGQVVKGIHALPPSHHSKKWGGG